MQDPEITARQFYKKIAYAYPLKGCRKFRFAGKQG
jgi:hypothetical protein